MGTWLDFKQLRQGLDFAAVLKHYGVELKLRRGEQHQGPCPLPGHQGQNRSRSFSANVKRGVFRCFSCGAEGNQLDFVARMEGLDPQNGSDIRQAALILAETFHLDGAKANDRARPSGGDGTKRVPKKKSEDAQQKAEQAATCPAIVNAPLNFQLQKLDGEHSYLLKGRGFTQETVAHFGLGYCSRGSLQERIAIPIHDDHGQLVGYAGRLVDDSKISKENPKYRFPSPREREGKRYEFRKSLLLYNGFGVGTGLADLIVVEGFASVWWLWQQGFPNVVALMGDSCSEEQATLIVKATHAAARIWLLPDGDGGGELCAQSVLQWVSPHRFIRWVRLADGQQPTDCSPDRLKTLFQFSSEPKGACDGRV